MKKEDLKKNKLLKKQLQQIEKKETKMLEKKEFKFVTEKIAPIQEKIEEKIPKKLEQTLEAAFESGFKLVFKKGVGVIEKSYNKEDKRAAFDIKHYAVQRQMSHKNIKKIDKSASKGILLNQLLTTVEGGVLGALGIGLPDIPILIGMLLKNIYEISLSYGFDYTEDKEKLYILYLICAGVTKEEVQAMYNSHLDEITKGDEQRLKETQHLDAVIKETSHRLAEAMLMAKFIQGLPVVGVVGGFSNFTIMKDISQMAKVKYKKRYLKEKLINQKL